MTLVTINVTAENIDGYWTRRREIGSIECPITRSVKEVVTPDTIVQVLTNDVCLDLPMDHLTVKFPNSEGLLVFDRPRNASKPNPFTFQLEIPNIFLREKYRKHEYINSDEIDFKKELYILVNKLIRNKTVDTCLIVEARVLDWHAAEVKRRIVTGENEERARFIARLSGFSSEEQKAITDFLMRRQKALMEGVLQD